MSNEKRLFEVLNSEFGARNIRNSKLPFNIVSNLNPKFPLRDYQKDAFRYFLTYLQEDFVLKPKICRHVLFHMATGSGKTLVMAGLITHLYSQGYRNFLFFVNSTNIIQKTKENFLAQSSSKYLFNNSITINNKVVQINEIESFSESNEGSINVLFCTIQDLHNQLTAPRENGFSIEDAKSHSIVLISDESHHTNTDTKRKSTKKSDSGYVSGDTWESTVEKILRSNPENLLLEFTATMDLNNSDIYSKYTDKIIFDYPLREFRKDGFSKEVSVEVFDSKDQLERAFVAVLLSQYRKKLMLRHRIGIKPVILFKSKTIEESKAFQKDFTKFIRGLVVRDVERIFSKDKPEITLLKNYLSDTLNDLDSFVLELKEDFAESRHLIVNSKDESEEKQLALNTLEDSDNGYRCIFAVDKLNEGWDVLNLFDIVRLYDTRDPTGNTGIGTKKVGTTTMSEAQLIGRGARYYPFKFGDSDEVFKRKFDADIDHELRLCETLSYHSAHNPKYIQELNSALHEIGIKAKDSVTQDLLVKQEFKLNPLYQKGVIFLNERKKRTDLDSPIFSDYIRGISKVRIESGLSTSVYVFADEKKETPLPFLSFDTSISSLPFELIAHAISTQPVLSFHNLHKIFPQLTSIKEFISSQEYLAKVKIEVSSTKSDLNLLSIDEQLQIAIEVINQIAEILASGKTEYFGSKEFQAFSIKEKFKDKRMNFNIDPDTEEQIGRSMNDPSNKYHLDLTSRKWYAYSDCFGTSEEKLLVKYIDKKIPELKSKYSDVYLVRNEKFFQIFDFRNGDATEPDFVLFLTSQDQSRSLQYQIFIEPKGKHLMAGDQWKQDLLVSLKQEANVVLLTQSEKVYVWGLPFYLNDNEEDFDANFKDLLQVD